MNAKELRLRNPGREAAPVAGRMQPHGDECRCACGALFARVVREGLEIKCRKCKAIVLITHDELVGMYHALGLDAPRLPGR